MQIIADLHLHSKFSRAVSKEMVIKEMSKQATRKGISLLGTGDWFHTIWIKQLQVDLEEWKDGIYKSRDDPNGAKFLLAAEISNIFKQGNQQHRVHTLVCAPNFSACEKISNELLKRGCNLSSDGRPIIGLKIEELAEIVYAADEKCFMIPAHIWTPWYSLYGSKSGFDSIDEAYGKYANQIFAVETGLSSDPAMNWSIVELERRMIVSFSDAHSGPKLGREATVFRTKNGISNDKLQMPNYSYDDVFWALAERFKGRNEGKLEVSFSIEFHPEEGKYHYTGHRKCGVVQSPDETKAKGGLCHVCGRPLTVGVMHRVGELAKEIVKPIKKMGKSGLVGYFHPADETRKGYVMLVPLYEILAEVNQMGTGSNKVAGDYDRLISQFGNEFEILLKTDIGSLSNTAGERIAEAVKKVREGSIYIKPGYDGVFGVVQIWPKEDEVPEKAKEQMTLF